VDSDEPDLAKLLDFGIAKGERLGDGLPAKATRQDLVVGTPEYMAPEQARGHTVDGRADLWAVGVILYECLVGQIPFAGASVVDVLVGLMEKPAPEPPAGTVPPALWQVIQKALSKRPADRFASAIEMREAIHAALAEISGPSLSVIPTPPASRTEDADGLGLEVAGRDEWESFARSQRRKQRVVASLAVMGLLGLGGALIHALMPEQPLNAEQENNDTAIHANLIAPGAGVRGTLPLPEGGRADQDYYVMALPPGLNVLTAHVTPTAPSAVNLGLTAWVDGKLLFKGYGTKIPHSRIPNLAVEGRVLYLKVREERATSDIPPTPQAVDYRLEIQPLRLIGVGEEREPNNTRAEAGFLLEGPDTMGILAPADDEDWFKISLPPDDREAEVEVRPSVDLAVTLGIYRADGQRERVKTGASGERISVKFRPKKCGVPCFVSLSASGKGTQADGPYRLLLR
jgi:hypothetical protein